MSAYLIEYQPQQGTKTLFTAVNGSGLSCTKKEMPTELSRKAGIKTKQFRRYSYYQDLETAEVISRAFNGEAL